MCKTVSEIRNLLPVECWSHVPDRKNPDDIPSSGATRLELVNKLWRDGPEPPAESTAAEEQSDVEGLPLECLEEIQASEKRAVHGS